MSVNEVTLIGHLGHDPELTHTKGGAPVCKMRIATTRTWTDKNDAKQEKTEWHRVTVWSKTAENCAKYLEKGRQVYVRGRIEYSQYEDKDGVTKYSTDIVAENVKFLGGKGTTKDREPGDDEWGDPPKDTGGSDF